MSQTESTMTALGTEAPEFTLPDVAGGEVSRTDLRGLPMLVMFICRHCPYVKDVQEELARLGNEYLAKGVAVVAISSNDATLQPDDRPESLREQGESLGLKFPYLYDESQEVARAFGAACTPDFFLYDQNHELVYRGQMDDSRPSNGKPVTGHDLRVALDQVLAGKFVTVEQRPSLGCNIKWKA